MVKVDILYVQTTGRHLTNLQSTVKSSSEDTNFWGEMNRREQLDRDFECRKPENQEDKDELKRALSIKEHTRSAWDERYRGLQSVSGVDTGDFIVATAQSTGKMESKDKKRSAGGFQQKLRNLFYQGRRIFTSTLTSK